MHNKEQPKMESFPERLLSEEEFYQSLNWNNFHFYFIDDPERPLSQVYRQRPHFQEVLEKSRVLVGALTREITSASREGYNDTINSLRRPLYAIYQMMYEINPNNAEIFR